MDLDRAEEALGCADEAVHVGVRSLAARGLDTQQVVAYDVAHSAAALATARAALAYGRHGDLEARIACAFVADVLSELTARIAGRSAQWGTRADVLGRAAAFVDAHRDPAVLAALCGEEGDPHLEPDLELARATFHRFAENEIRPTPSTCTARTRTSPSRSSTGSPASAGSGSRCPRTTEGRRRAPRATPWRWSSRPRSSRGARSGSAGRSSRDPRSSPAPSCAGAPRNRSAGGSRSSRAVSCSRRSP